MWNLHLVDHPFSNCRIGKQSALIGLNLWHPWIIHFWRSRLFKHKQTWDQIPIFFRDNQEFGFHYVVQAFQDFCILPQVPLWQRPKKILQWGVHLHLQGSNGNSGNMTIPVKWFLRSLSAQSLNKKLIPSIHLWELRLWLEQGFPTSKCVATESWRIHPGLWFNYWVWSHVCFHIQREGVPFSNINNNIDKMNCRQRTASAWVVVCPCSEHVQIHLYI